MRQRPPPRRDMTIVSGPLLLGSWPQPETDPSHLAPSKDAPFLCTRWPRGAGWTSASPVTRWKEALRSREAKQAARDFVSVKPRDAPSAS